MTLGKQWLLEYRRAYFAKCPLSWACKGYFDKVVKTAPAKTVCSTARACPAGVSEKGRCSSALWCCFLWAGCLWSQAHCTVSLFIWQFPVLSRFFHPEDCFSFYWRHRLGSVCLSSAPSNSAGVFVISCCRDWGLCWKEHWLCPFTTFVALISKWHSVVLGIILRGGKPVFPPSPGADTETLGETVKAFSRPAWALGFGGRAGAVQAWTCPEAALGFVFLIFPVVW